jgi:hypothetical protein
MEARGIRLSNLQNSQQFLQSAAERSLAERRLAHNFGWDGTERRHHPRFNVRWNGALERASSDSRQSFQVRLSDVSEGGCCIFLRTDPALPNVGNFFVSDSPLNLKMFLPSGEVSAQVVIRWYMPIEDNAYAAGMQFLMIAPRHFSRLRKAIQEIGRS